MKAKGWVEKFDIYLQSAHLDYVRAKPFRSMTNSGTTQKPELTTLRLLPRLHVLSPMMTPGVPWFAISVRASLFKRKIEYQSNVDRIDWMGFGELSLVFTSPCFKRLTPEFLAYFSPDTTHSSIIQFSLPAR